MQMPRAATEMGLSGRPGIYSGGRGGSHGAALCITLMLVLLGIKSGFRVAELLSVQVGDVWQYERMVDTITVQRRHLKGGKSGRTSGRTVPLHLDAKIALAEWLFVLRQQLGISARSYVSVSWKGVNRPISTVQAWRILHEACETNELQGKLGTHCMRKTFAKKVHDQLGHDLYKTQRALGHQNINDTVKYLSVDQDEIDQAILAS